MDIRSLLNRFPFPYVHADGFRVPLWYPILFNPASMPQWGRVPDIQWTGHARLQIREVAHNFCLGKKMFHSGLHFFSFLLSLIASKASPAGVASLQFIRILPVTQSVSAPQTACERALMHFLVQGQTCRCSPLRPCATTRREGAERPSAASVNSDLSHCGCALTAPTRRCVFVHAGKLSRAFKEI